MKRWIAMLSLLAVPVMAQGPWVPVSVNTNTWECKPYFPGGTNYWTNLAANVETPTNPVTPPVTASLTNALPSYYADAVLWYSFTTNDLGTSVYDNTGRGNDGVVGTDGGTLPTWTNYCMRLDASLKNYFQTVASDIGYLATELTLSMWVNYHGSPGAFDALLLSGDSASLGSGGTFSGLDIKDASGTLHGGCYGYWGPPGLHKNPDIYDPSTGTLSNAWQHVVLAYRRNSGTDYQYTADILLYVDGVLLDSTTVAPDVSIIVDNPWMVGYASGGLYLTSNYSFLDAFVDDVVIATNYWDSAAVSTVYAAGRSGAP